MSELKPCPFCGGVAIDDPWICCADSSCIGRNVAAWDEEAWNTRPKSEAEELLEWLRENDYSLIFMASEERWRVETYDAFGDEKILGTGRTPLDALKAAKEAME